MRDQDTTNFEQVKNNYGKSDGPALTIRQGNTCYINADASKKWFSDVDSVGVYVDRENSLIGLAPGENGDASYSLSHLDNSGISLKLNRALNELGIDRDQMDGKLIIPLCKNGSLITADLQQQTGGGGGE